jgi:hypothetical protein
MYRAKGAGGNLVLASSTTASFRRVRFPRQDTHTARGMPKGYEASRVTYTPPKRA